MIELTLEARSNMQLNASNRRQQHQLIPRHRERLRLLRGRASHQKHASAILFVTLDPVTIHRHITLTHELSPSTRTRVGYASPSPSISAHPGHCARLSPTVSTKRTRTLVIFRQGHSTPFELRPNVHLAGKHSQRVRPRIRAALEVVPASSTPRAHRNLRRRPPLLPPKHPQTRRDERRELHRTPPHQRRPRPAYTPRTPVDEGKSSSSRPGTCNVANRRASANCC